MIYLDPPFNSKRFYSASIRKEASGASFKDMWTWGDVGFGLLIRLTETYPSLVKFIEAIEYSHSKGMMSYIVFMAQRIFKLHRILKLTGFFIYIVI